MVANAREDLALIAAVTAAAVLLNMVAAVFAGLLLGLVLFAARNARRPVRNVWTGAQLSSNCARSRAELEVLARHGAAIRIFELEGDLFFGAADGLERSLVKGADGAACIIVDWSRVRHIDSSLTLSLGKFERRARRQGLLPIHAGSDAQDGNVEAELRRHLPQARFAPDLDHALELAENQIIKLHGHPGSVDSTAAMESVSLFQGLSARDRSRLEEAMPRKVFPAGQAIISAGDPSDELMLVLQGSASIVVRTPEGKVVRLAGVRCGATIGEIGFLDGAPRSATIVAEDEVIVAELHRDTYDELCRTDPQLVQRLLGNIALDVATRLRHTNRLAMARNGQR
jgi:hypothetical protein